MYLLCYIPFALFSIINSYTIYISHYSPELYYVLKKELENNGCYVRSLEEVSQDPHSDYMKADAIITMNVDPEISNRIEKYNHTASKKIKLYSVALEPPHVDWQAYNILFYEKYDLIFLLDDSLQRNYPQLKKYIKINYPQRNLELRSNPIPFKERKLLTMVNSYKLKASYSPTREYDLYQQRLRLIDYFEGKDCFDFYGALWQDGPYKHHASFKGPVANKYTTLQKYKFIICFENSYITPGYITEKIFDSFISATVPVYYGAPNVTDYIPAETFIDMRNFSNFEELHVFLEAMSEATYNNYLCAIQSFLKTTEAFSFLNTSVAQIITKHIIDESM